MRLLSLLIVFLLLAGDVSAKIASGSRTHDGRFDGTQFQIYTYRPACSRPDLLLVLHGTGRNADGYRDSARRLADRQCLVVVAPLFDEERFPSDDYQRGGILDSRDRLLPASEWSTRFVSRMVVWAKKQLGGTPKTYLYGHSAGGQFLSRVAAYDPVAGVARYVLANPSTYVLPSLSEAVTYGFDALATDPAEREALRRYLALPLTIYLGELDNDPNDPDLARGSAAMRQGANRRERGERTFALGRQVARENGWTFNWRLTIAPGVAHTNGGMLRSSAAKEAFGF